MGIQYVKDVTLIRHAYVLTKHQRRGIGRKLLNQALQHEDYLDKPISAQVSTELSLKALYNKGFRNRELGDAPFEDYLDKFREYESLNMLLN